MQLEDYFEFEKSSTKFGEVERIRVKGTRVAVEVIIKDYLGGFTPEQIVSNYNRSLDLEQVFATLTYYLHNKAALDAYMEQVREVEDSHYQDYLKQEQPEVVKRLLALRGEQRPSPTGSQ